MNKDLIIKKLRGIEAWAEGLRDECHNTIKMLEADSSASSTQKGHLKELGAKAVADRDQRMLKRQMNKATA